MSACADRVERSGALIGERHSAASSAWRRSAALYLTPCRWADACAVLHWRVGTSSSLGMGRLTASWGFSSRSVPLDDADSGRWFVCGRCRVQVLLCRRCDRGQIYCGPRCSMAARRGFQRAAGQRHQSSRGGRVLHAARSKRWRLRVAQRALLKVAPADFVTHQGSLGASADAPLAPCDPDPAAPVEPSIPSALRCRRCGCALPSWVRSRFVRYGPGSTWPLRPRDHSP